MSNRFSALLPPHIQHLVAYDPGYEPSEIRHQLGLPEIIELGSNENSFGPAPAVRELLRQPNLQGFRYPDAGGRALKTALSELYQLPSTHFTLGNGTHELLTLIAETVCNPADEVIHAQYGFAVYRLAALGAGATPVAVAVDRQFNVSVSALLGAITARTKLVYLANPNNPTATMMTQAELVSLLSQTPDHVLVVLDEAYIEYLAPEKLGHDVAYGLSVLAQFPNLIIARTCSKIYGLASLRVGYTIAHPDFANVLERTRLSFNVNGLALRAATLAIADQAHIHWVREQISLQRTALFQALAALKLRVLPSECNFVLIDFSQPNQAAGQSDATWIERGLVQRGVIVRPVRAYGLPQYLRVTVGTEYENQKFLSALQRVLSAM